jgi:ComF family protein
MQTIGNNLLHLFFPKLCILCREALGVHEEDLCLACLSNLPHLPCYHQEDNPVFRLLEGRVRITFGAAFFYYEKGSKIQHLIHAFNYQGNKNLARQLGRQAAMFLPPQPANCRPVDLLIPIPLHPQKQRKRGYNQAEWIAMGLASVWNIPVCNHVLQRNIQTRTQTNKTLYDRWGNMQNAFLLKDPETLQDKHVLLVDDVMTSGSTLGASAETLLRIPDIQVSVFALSLA